MRHGSTLRWRNAIAWITWIVCIKLHVSEMMLNLGAAGPGAAALILSRRSRSPLPRISSVRILLFLLVAAGCSVILSQNYAWRATHPLHFRWDQWSLVPAIPSAWIVTAAMSRDPGNKDIGIHLDGPIPNLRRVHRNYDRAFLDCF